MVLGVTLVAVCVLYAGALLLGWQLAKRGRLQVTELIQHGPSFTDPLTRRFQEWGRREKMDALRRQQWTRLWLLIVANNLGAVALVGRTLYGATLVLAVYLTYRQGLGQGAFLAQSSLRPRGALLQVAVLEFGAYLLATALGVNLVMTPVSGGAFRDALESLAAFYPVVAAALLLGAWLEVRAVRARIPAGFAIPANLTLDEMRAKALEMLKQHSSQQADMSPRPPGGAGTSS